MEWGEAHRCLTEGSPFLPNLMLGISRGSRQLGAPKLVFLPCWALLA